MLTTSVERLEGATIKLTVTVSADEVDASVKKAYETLGAKVRVPGFRKGKAPNPVVDNYLGRDYVLGEATEALVDSTYPKALDQEALRPIDSPDMDEVTPVVRGEDFTYVAKVELRPELTLSHTDGILVVVMPKNVTEAQIDEQIEIARDRFASLEPVEDRGVEANDFALISFVGDVDGEAYDGNMVDKYLYELGQGQMPPAFDEGLIGMKAGEEKRIEFVIPESSSNQEYVGKTAGFNVTVHEIKSKVLPEVDDDFAVSVGGYDSVELMREDLRIRMQATQELQHERDKEEKLKAQLAERLIGDVPETMVRAKTNQLMREFESKLQQEGMTVQSYVASIGVPIEVLEADINRQGEQVVKEELALEALFRQEGKEITDEDVREEIATMVSGSETVDNMLARWTENGLLPVVREQIVQQRAVKWLIDNATIVERDISKETADVDADSSTDAVPADADADADPDEKSEE